MNEHEIVRRLVLRMAREIAPKSNAAGLMQDWISNNGQWLIGDGWTAPKKPDWAAFVAAVQAAPSRGEPRPRVLELADALGQMLHLAEFDASLLTLMIACDRLPKLSQLVGRMGDQVNDFPAVLGELAGADALEAGPRVRRSDVLKLGMLSFAIRPHDDAVEIRWTLERILDRDPTPAELGEMLAGRRQAATLGLDDFAHVADADFLVRLLAGAARNRAHGVNILIHGPPGTGKTELARTLAAAAGCPLHEDFGDRLSFANCCASVAPLALASVWKRKPQRFWY